MGWGGRGYELQSYANDVVAAIQDMCATSHGRIAPPTIVTESGRSLSSHHAVLVFDGRCENGPSFSSPSSSAFSSPFSSLSVPLPPPPPGRASYFLATLGEVVRDADVSHSSPPSKNESKNESKNAMGSGVGVDVNDGEFWDDWRQFKRESEEKFKHGAMTLEELAWAEAALDRIATRAAQQERGGGGGEWGGGGMPVACVANLSIFRSMVDAWAIDQPFPILPLYPSEGKGEDGKGEGEGRGGERGEEKGEEGKGEEGKGLAGGPPDATLRLYDITCDSDGEIKEFVSAPHTQGPWEGGGGEQREGAGGSLCA